MSGGGKRMQPAPHVPWIALADIAWQIVILFLVASAFIVTNSVSMDLPSMTQQQQQDQTEPVQVIAGADLLQVTEGTNAAVNIDYPELRATLQNLLANRRGQDRAVVIMCKPDLPWQRQVDVMTDVAKAGGLPVIAAEE